MDVIVRGELRVIGKGRVYRLQGSVDVIVSGGKDV